MHADTEVPDQAAELVERVAAIDIAKASGTVCMRLPHPNRETPTVTQLRRRT
ncbi:hypothetical protein [Streptomyces cyaneochromogenes]|uniref:hypothetical protein n=1 Tax=Streptomyces cyaneochromogenes TaxID=2496836 RepID=UPI00158A8D35|nr:hypothetical protein [Streptomyces cyaneochromogenes]